MARRLRALALFAMTMGYALVTQVAMSNEAAAQAGELTTVTRALRDLEEAIRPEALDPTFLPARAAFRTDLEGARSHREVAQKLEQLEAALSWEAMHPSWRNARPDWLRSLGASPRTNELARLLLVLERSIEAEAMNARWEENRASWVARLLPLSSANRAERTSASAPNLRIGNEVEVEWNGTWYRASIVAINPNATYRIHYTGWESSWDEDVPASRIR